MNKLEETLRVIRTQKATLKKQMKTETNRKKLMSLAHEVQELSVEEDDCLHKLGLK